MPPHHIPPCLFPGRGTQEVEMGADEGAMRARCSSPPWGSTSWCTKRSTNSSSSFFWTDKLNAFLASIGQPMEAFEAAFEKIVKKDAGAQTMAELMWCATTSSSVSSCASERRSLPHACPDSAFYSHLLSLHFSYCLSSRFSSAPAPSPSYPRRTWWIPSLDALASARPAMGPVLRPARRKSLNRCEGEEGEGLKIMTGGG
ncbi:unnamed protein product, partial [Prorocentrum cordatum]